MAAMKSVAAFTICSAYLVGSDCLIVAPLSGFLGALGESVQVLVKGAGSDVSIVKEVPRAPWRRAYSSRSDRAARAAYNIA